jgi:hypothetical protein
MSWEYAAKPWHSRTSHIQHALDDRAHHGSLAQDDKFEAIA